MRKVTIAAALCALTLAGCAQPTADDSPAGPVEPAKSVQAPTPTTPPMHKVGETVELKDSEGNTAKVTITSSKYDAKAVMPKSGPAENGGYLTTEVEWETTAGMMSPSIMSFNTQDANGQVATMAWDSTFGTGPVLAGEKRKGTMVDDIGPGPWRITYGAQLGTPVFWKIEAS